MQSEPAQPRRLRTLLGIWLAIRIPWHRRNGNASNHPILMPHPTDLIELRCLGCDRPVRYPAVRAAEAALDNRPLAVFCSRRCNIRYVAKEGSAAIERQ